MIFYSTGEAAKKIGVSLITLKRYIAAKKIPLPPPRVGGVRVRLWSEEDIQNVRQLLPNIANGRKTRYKKKQSAVSTQQSAKTKKKAQARAPQPQHAKSARIGGPKPAPHKSK
jgi:DNA-binding transcriptional MerR regulator